MKTVRFYGGSDDLFEVDGAFCEEVGCYDSHGIVQLTSNGGRLLVVGEYSPGHSPDGTWCIGVQTVEEGDDPPDWPLRMKRCKEANYSLAIEIDVPDDTTLAVLDDGEDYEDDDCEDNE